MRVILRPPTPSDVAEVAANMRAIDVMECKLVADLGPIEALQEAVEISDEAYAAEVEGKVISIFGLNTSFLGEEGYPWMLSIEGIERHARVVLTVSARYAERWRSKCETLANIVHADNRQAIRYLKWCGFEFGSAIEVKGAPFLPFYWRRQEARAA